MRWLRTLHTPRWTGPRSDHFDGRRFGHPWPAGRQSTWDLLRFLPRFFLRIDAGPWTRRDLPPGPPPPARADLRITWIGHATALLQVSGRNYLTDPVWSRRCSPVPFAGPARMRPPGLSLDDLPPLDAILLSHNHYDHLDIATLRALQDRSAAPVIAPLGHAALLRGAGLATPRELDWWEADPELPVTLVPAQHFSARGPFDRDAALWGGFLVDGRVYFAGDTGYGPHFAEIRKRLGPPEVALIPVGAYRPISFMRPVHLGPDDAVQAAADLGATWSIPIHFGSFPLGLDGMDEAGDAVMAHGAPGWRRLAEGEGWAPPREDSAASG